MPRPKDNPGGGKLLGSLPFVGRTFEGHFRDTPFVLDMDANLYVGPADGAPREQHAAVEVVYRFLAETGRIEAPLREVLRDRRLLLDAFSAFDRSREGGEEQEFSILLHGTYDGELLERAEDDDLPAGPCGLAVNQVKLRFYRLCRRLDRSWRTRSLEPHQAAAERRLMVSVYVREES